MKPLYQYSLLRRAILVAMLGVTGTSSATTLIDKDTFIDANSPVNENYRIENGATLSVNGATTGNITISDGHLAMNGGSVNLLYGEYGATADIADATLKAVSLAGDSRLSRTVIEGQLITWLMNFSATSISAQQFYAYETQSTVEKGYFEQTERMYAGAVYLTSSEGIFTDSVIKGIKTAVYLEGNGSVDLIRSSISATEGSAFDIARGNQKILLQGSSASSQTGELLVARTGSSVNLALDASHAAGDVRAEGSAVVDVALTNGSVLSGGMTNVNSLMLGNASLYEMTSSSDIRTLSMAGGMVKFAPAEAGEHHTLTLGSLEGNGHFMMNIDTENGSSDLLDVTGHAEGSHTLHLAASGREAENTDPLTLVRTGGGDAEFALNGGRVDMGAWQQELVRNGNQWELVQAKGATSASTDAMLAMASAPQFMHQGELKVLRSRLAVKDADNAAGVWGTMLYNRSDIEGAQGSAYRLTQNGMMLGGDKVTDTRAGELTTGAYLSQSTGNIKHARGGDSKVTGYGGGVYARLSAENGAYASTSAQIGHFSNKLNARMSDGGTARAGWNSLGYGLMVETGRQIAVGETTSLTPFVGVNAWLTPSENVTLSNGMTAETGDNRSLLAEAGVRMSTRLDVAEMAVTPYVTLAVQQELVKSGSTQINDAYDFTNDFTGTGGTIAGGISVAIAPTASVWLEAEYGKSEQTESALTGNVGFRVAF
ncbi:MULTISPECIES: autotransporter outer membrane beta-barrel domain-containing protein [Enterobacter]|jgi:outer membrane autotransporter protein|uniref:autotransporter outer membrane beta-barrel domain-containing protein n=1 Tax=Enterobacter TaxID=547 RepID=UPI0015E4CF45|nr:MULTISPECIES: autotransporter outer membrane beta-barrel domain-containing protein [Enterobacter]QLO89708.1 autotransporter outer membrane beta-barrel domain-containing protein [Enterobacter sp. RHBSTW-00975]HDR2461384.1 autotransporter outer membrane beta-barrel domain-containing protein [Enterobacter ludwigii]